MLAVTTGAAGPFWGSALSMTDASAADSPDHPVVVLDTTAGPITLELDRTKAPITVDNFLKYVDAGFFDGLIFHRVIPGFMIQGGGFNEQLQEKSEGMRPPIQNEARNGLSNVRGTIAMARTSNPNSATSQFFINLVDNRSSLDPNPDSAGYAVFGKVICGHERRRHDRPGPDGTEKLAAGGLSTMSPSSRSSSRVPGGSPAPDDFFAADRARSGEALTRLASRSNMGPPERLTTRRGAQASGHRDHSLTWTSHEER